MNTETGPASNLTLCFPYYNQPEILALQYNILSSFPVPFEIVICDDGSQVHPAKDVPIPENLKNRVRIFKITKDRPWNWHAARNICAHEANTKWILLTDLDHIVSGQAIGEVFDCKLDTRKVYNLTRYDYKTFQRTRHPKTGKPKNHPNTWLMTKKLYWKIGGYDERWSGVYGGDGSYATRVRRFASLDISPQFIYRVSRAEVGDASGEGAERKEKRAKNWRAKFKRKLESSGGLDAIVTLSQEYVREI